MKVNIGNEKHNKYLDEVMKNNYADYNYTVGLSTLLTHIICYSTKYFFNITIDKLALFNNFNILKEIYEEIVNLKVNNLSKDKIIRYINSFVDTVLIISVQIDSIMNNEKYRIELKELCNKYFCI